MDGTDIGVVQRGGSSGLALKTGKHLRVFSYIIGEKLQSDKATEFDVLRLVHHTHTTTAELLDSAVVRDCFPNERVGIRHAAVILGWGRRQVNEEGQQWVKSTRRSLKS